MKKKKKINKRIVKRNPSEKLSNEFLIIYENIKRVYSEFYYLDKYKIDNKTLKNFNKNNEYELDELFLILETFLYYSIEFGARSGEGKNWKFYEILDPIKNKRNLTSDKILEISDDIIRILYEINDQIEFNRDFTENKKYIKIFKDLSEKSLKLSNKLDFN